MNRRLFISAAIERRRFLGTLAVLPLSLCLPASAEAHPTAVIVVFVSGVEAYMEALRGLGSGLAKLTPRPFLIDLKSPDAAADLTGALGAGQQRVVIAIGAEALAAVTAHSADALITSTMLLRSDRPHRVPGVTGAPRSSAVYLDIPIASLLSELKILLPSKNRCGMIHNSAREDPDPSLPARVKQLGFTLDDADCSQPENLVKSFLSLKGKVDFVVLLPDSSLYNNTTVRPLILASLETRLPIVGFSSSFVRAGAALGVYPDFRDVGAQTADIVQKVIAGKIGLSDENPRKLQVAVNQRVLRVLGLNCNETPGLVIFR